MARHRNPGEKVPSRALPDPVRQGKGSAGKPGAGGKRTLGCHERKKSAFPLRSVDFNKISRPRGQRQVRQNWCIRILREIGHTGPTFFRFTKGQPLKHSQGSDRTLGRRDAVSSDWHWGSPPTMAPLDGLGRARGKTFPSCILAASGSRIRVPCPARSKIWDESPPLERKLAIDA